MRLGPGGSPSSTANRHNEQSICQLIDIMKDQARLDMRLNT